MGSQETLKNICQKNGCVWAIESTGEVDNTPPKGEMYCFWLLDPEKTRTEKGCDAAASNEGVDLAHGDGPRFGVMREKDFTMNEDYDNPPPNHPIGPMLK